MRPPKFVIKILATAQQKRIKKNNTSPWQTQKKTLASILETFNGTEWESHFNLQKIKNEKDLELLIPNTKDDYYEGLIQEILKNNKENMIQRAPLAYMAKTSGSTAKSKYIPYTEALIKNFKRFSLDVFLHFSYTNNCFDVMKGNILVSPSLLKTEDNDQGIHIGTGTGIMTKLAPKFSRKIVKPFVQNLDHSNFDVKINAMIEESYPLDIRSFTCAPAFAIPVLSALFKKAKNLKRDVHSIHDIWPNLNFYIFSASSVIPYEKKLREFLGDSIPFLEVYSSTESPFAYQWRPDRPQELYLDLESCFYFFQAEGSEKDSVKFTVKDIEEGKRYRLLLTTYGGLFNYDIGDIVEVVSKSPFLIKVAGREKEEANIGGNERVPLALIKEALKEVTDDFDNFFIYPYQLEDKKGYMWCVETDHSLKNETELLQKLDLALQGKSFGYKVARESNNRLLPPRIRTIPTGSIRQFILEHKSFGQGKFLMVHNSNTETDEFFEWLNDKKASQ